MKYLAVLLQISLPNISGFNDNLSYFIVNTFANKEPTHFYWGKCLNDVTIGI